MAHLYCLKSRYLLKIFEVQTEAAKSFDFSAISLTFIIVWQAFCLTDTLELWILCCLYRFQIFQHFFPAEESHFYKATAGLRFHFVKNGGLLQVTSLALRRHAGFHAACFETAKCWLSFPDYSPLRCQPQQLYQELKIFSCFAGLLHPSPPAHLPVSLQLGAKIHGAVWGGKVLVYGQSSLSYIISMEKRRKKKRRKKKRKKERKGNSVFDPSCCEDSIRNMI